MPIGHHSVEFAALLAWILFILYLGRTIPVFCRPLLDWRDPSIGYRLIVDEQFTNYELVLVCMVPGFLYMAFALIPVGGKMGFGGRGLLPQDRLRLGLGWLLWHTQAVAVTLTIVELAKPAAGRLRPDFISRLRSVGLNEQSTPEELCAAAVTHPTVRQGRLSFPSGHSACAFAAMAPLSVFLATVLPNVLTGMFGADGGRKSFVESLMTSPTVRSMLGLLPHAFGLWVAISRTQDNRHHFSDILTGSLIGLLCSVATYWIRAQPPSKRATSQAADWELSAIALPLEDGFVGAQDAGGRGLPV